MRYCTHGKVDSNGKKVPKIVRKSDALKPLLPFNDVKVKLIFVVVVT